MRQVFCSILIATMVSNVLHAQAGGLNGFQFVDTFVQRLEWEGVIFVRVARPAPFDTSATVEIENLTVSGLPDSATEGQDFKFLAKTLEFKPGEEVKGFPIELLRDGLMETPEAFQIGIVKVTGGSIGANPTAKVWIISDETAIEFEPPKSGGVFSANETEGKLTLALVRSSAPSGNLVSSDVFVEVDEAPGTNFRGKEFLLPSGPIVFRPGETRKLFDVTLIDNDRLDGTREFSLQLRTGAVGLIGPNNSVRVQILDDDETEFAFVDTFMQRSERDSVIPIRVKRRFPSDTAATVEFENLTPPEAPGAATEGKDFKFFTKTLEFKPGEEVKVLTIDLLKDWLIEDPEHFAIGIVKTGGRTSHFNSTAQLVILSDEKGISFEVPKPNGSFSALETDGKLTLALFRDTTPLDTVSVEVDEAPGTNYKGRDFLLPAGPILFLPGETRKWIDVTILDNNTVDGNREFALELKNPVGGAINPSNQIRVEVIDNERGTRFSRASFETLENSGRLIILLQRDAQLDISDSIEVRVLPGDAAGFAATEGVDFTLPDKRVTFGPGETDAAVAIDLINDGFVEGAESFTIELFNSSGAPPSEPRRASVSIYDNERGFHVASYEAVFESAPFLRVIVARGGDNLGPASLDFAVTGEATGIDFEPSSGTLRFAEGERFQTLFVPLLDDSVVDGEKWLAVTLSHPADGSAISANGPHFIPLRDDEFHRYVCDCPDSENPPPDDPPARFYPEIQAAPIDAKEAIVHVRRLGNSDQPLTVNFTTRDQSALAGVHYVAQSSVPVAFAPMETEKDVRIPLLPGPIPGREVTLEPILHGIEGGKGWTNNAALKLVNSSLPGTVDPSFDAGEIFIPQVHRGDGTKPGRGAFQPWSSVRSVELAADGSVFVGGEFDYIQEVRRGGIAKLTPFGKLDPTFLAPLPHEQYGHLWRQPGGDLLASRSWEQPQWLLRLNEDATEAEDWPNPEYWENRLFESLFSHVPTAALIKGGLPEGKFLATRYEESLTSLFRFHANGTVDKRLGPKGISPTLKLVERDGKMLFDSWSETEQVYRWMRLLPDGELDTSFVSSVASTNPQNVFQQPDGKYLITSYLEEPDRGGRATLFRMNANGTSDPTFAIAADLFLSDSPNVPNPTEDQISAIAVQPDGRILVGGAFNNARSISRGGLLRLNPNGSLDTSFDVGKGPSGFGDLFRPRVNRIVLQPDGQILVAGSFWGFDGIPRTHIVRLNGDGKALRLGQPLLSSDGSLRIPVFTGGRSPASLELQTSATLAFPVWTTAAAAISREEPPSFLIPSPADAAQRYFRVVAK